MLLVGTWRGKSFKESLKSLEADIQYANTLCKGSVDDESTP